MDFNKLDVFVQNIFGNIRGKTNDCPVFLCNNIFLNLFQLNGGKIKRIAPL